MIAGAVGSCLRCCRDRLPKVDFTPPERCGQRAALASNRGVTPAGSRLPWSGQLGDSLLVGGNRCFESLAARRANHPVRLDAIVADLEQVVPERGRPAANHLGYAIPLRLRSPNGELTLLTTLAHFATAIDVTVSELSLEAFLPGDGRPRRRSLSPTGEVRQDEFVMVGQPVNDG